MALPYFQSTDRNFSMLQTAWAALLNPLLNVPIKQPEISVSSESFATTSLTYVDVPNVAVTIKTTGGPVMLFLQPSDPTQQAYLASSSVPGVGVVSYVENNFNTIAQYLFEPDTNATPLSLVFIRALPAGTYKYKLQVKKQSGAGNIQVNNMALVAQEL